MHDLVKWMAVDKVLKRSFNFCKCGLFYYYFRSLISKITNVTERHIKTSVCLVFENIQLLTHITGFLLVLSLPIACSSFTYVHVATKIWTTFFLIHTYLNFANRSDSATHLSSITKSR